MQGLVARWQRAALESFTSALERLVCGAVRQCKLRKGVLTTFPLQLMAPLAQAVLWQLMNGQGECVPATLEQQRRGHSAVLREALAS